MSRRGEGGGGMGEAVASIKGKQSLSAIYGGLGYSQSNEALLVRCTPSSNRTLLYYHLSKCTLVLSNLSRCAFSSAGYPRLIKEIGRMNGGNENISFIFAILSVLG